MIVLRRGYFRMMVIKNRIATRSCQTYTRLTHKPSGPALQRRRRERIIAVPPVRRLFRTGYLTQRSESQILHYSVISAILGNNPGG